MKKHLMVPMKCFFHPQKRILIGKRNIEVIDLKNQSKINLSIAELYMLLECKPEITHMIMILLGNGKASVEFYNMMVDIYQTPHKVLLREQLMRPLILQWNKDEYIFQLSKSTNFIVAKCQGEIRGILYDDYNFIEFVGEEEIEKFFEIENDIKQLCVKAFQ